MLSVRYIFHDTQLYLPLRLNLGLCIGLLALTCSSLFVLQPKIPLLYSLAQPADALVETPWLLLLPICALCSFAVNVFLLVRLRHYQAHVLEPFWAWTMVVVTSIFWIAFARIVYIVI
jgi:hypothetical protein